MDARASGTSPRLFSSHAALVKYTRKNKKFFGKKEAKQDEFLKVLLKPVF